MGKDVKAICLDQGWETAFIKTDHNLLQFAVLEIKSPPSTCLEDVV